MWSHRHVNTAMVKSALVVTRRGICGKGPGRRKGKLVRFSASVALWSAFLISPNEGRQSASSSLEAVMCLSMKTLVHIFLCRKKSRLWERSLLKEMLRNRSRSYKQSTDFLYMQVESSFFYWEKSYFVPSLCPSCVRYWEARSLAFAFRDLSLLHEFVLHGTHWVSITWLPWMS